MQVPDKYSQGFLKWIVCFAAESLIFLSLLSKQEKELSLLENLWNQVSWTRLRKICLEQWYIGYSLSGELIFLSPVRSTFGTHQVRRRCTWHVSVATWRVWKSCWRKVRLGLTSKTATERRLCTLLPSMIPLPSFRWDSAGVLHIHIWVF